MNPIVSFEQSGVQVLAELDTTSAEFIHQLSDDWMLTSHYAIGLVDTRGNVQIDQFDVSGKVGPILERNVPISISELQLKQDNSTLSFEWELDARFINGDATLWTSTSSNPDMTPAWEEITRLNPKTLEHHITFDELGEAWYALTLEGNWGASPGSHLDDRILLGQNAVFFVPQEQPEDRETSNDSGAIERVDLPEFMLHLTEENQSLNNGDWLTLQPQTNDTFTLRFTHSQTNSTIRWTDALNTNPFWSSASQSGDEFSIMVEEPVNLIHIESTNVNGEIHIIRIGIDWPEEEIVQPNNSSDSQLVDDKEASPEDSVSLPLLLIVGVIAAYILIIVSMKGNEENVFKTEEE